MASSTTHQRGGDVQKLLDANDKMLYTWNNLLESRPTLDKKDEYKEWHVKCVRYKEQIARSLERLAALADDQIAKKDSNGPTAATATSPAAPPSSSTAAGNVDPSATQQQQHLQKQKMLQQQHLLQLQNQQQQQLQAAAAAQLQQKKQQQLHQQHHNMQQHATSTTSAPPTGFPPGTDLAAMQLAMSQMMPMNMNQMMAGYPTMNNAAADMSNLFLMANGNAGGTNGAGNSNVDGMNHMNLFNYNMQAAAAAYGNQLYGANFNPALVQNMMGGGGGGGYPAQAVMQAQMAAGNGSNNTQGFPYSTVATTTNATSTSSATTATSAADPNLFFSDNDTVRNVMDDFMSSSE